MIEAGPSTLTLIGLIMMIAALPVALIAAFIDLVMDTFPGFFFVPIVMLIIGVTLAFAGVL